MYALPHWIWIAAISAVAGAAFLKGGASERRGAAYYVAAWLATWALRDNDRLQVQYATFAIDLALLAALIHLALGSRRYWPMATAGFHLLAVLTHVGRILDSRLSPWAYYTAAQLWGYLILASIAVGIANHARRARRGSHASGAPAVEA